MVRREVARLLAERRRSRTPDLAKAKARLVQVDQEIGYLMAAIKAGVLTVSTKSELVKLEIEQRQLQGTLQSKGTKADRVADFVPDTIGHFKAALADLTTVTKHQVAKQAAGIFRDFNGGADHPAPDG